MKSGISTACLYPMKTEKALAELIAMDFQLFEIFFNTLSEMQPEYINHLKTMLDEHGCSVKSIHPFTSAFEGHLLFSDYDRRFEDGLEFYKQYFNAANQLGAAILVLHGQKDYQGSQIAEDTYFEHYERLYELGKTFGILVAQENVNAFRSQSPWFIRRMRAFTKDECAFVLDIKQAVRAKKDPFEMCAAMGERLVHVHFNDNNGINDCLLPGKGKMNFPRLKQQLINYHYDGDAILEVYRKNFSGLGELAEAKGILDDFVK